MGTLVIVFYCADLDLTRQFYECLGMVFQEEKHGKGPVHYAAAFQGAVLELYPDGLEQPTRARASTDGRQRVLWSTARFDRVLASVKAMGLPKERVKRNRRTKLRSVLVLDPDARTVLIRELKDASGMN